MPEFKLNHFVPKCHFKPFSLQEEGAAINLLNINAEKFVESASVKHQCAKDYFYGKDGELEKVFQKVEGLYSMLVKQIAAGEKSISQENLDGLRDFVYFQYSRTEHAIRRTQIAFAEMDALIKEGFVQHNPSRAESDEELVRDSLRMFIKTRDAIADLKTCIIENKTNTDFVTSDDPAVLANRFAQNQRVSKNGAGLKNAGAMLFMPITPKHCVISYDPGIYAIPEKRDNFVTTSSPADILAINELQYLKAHKNIYFSDWEARSQIIDNFKLVKADRPEKWFELGFAAFDKEDSDSSWFKVTRSKEERANTDRALVSIRLKHPEPKNWCSKIKLRVMKRYIDTKSGAGLIRRTLEESFE